MASGHVKELISTFLCLTGPRESPHLPIVIRSKVLGSSVHWICIRPCWGWNAECVIYQNSTGDSKSNSIWDRTLKGLLNCTREQLCKPWSDENLEVKFLSFEEMESLTIEDHICYDFTSMLYKFTRAKAWPFEWTKQWLATKKPQRTVERYGVRDLMQWSWKAFCKSYIQA